jgi:hypothetical protein
VSFQGLRFKQLNSASLTELQGISKKLPEVITAGTTTVGLSLSLEMKLSQFTAPGFGSMTLPVLC